MDALCRPGWFVTGTDTGVGKTWVSLALLRALRLAGYSAAGMKPVASGCELRQGVPVNPDALQLQAASVPEVDYALVNPYAFMPPVSPHIAAELAGQRIDLELIAARYGHLCQIADAVVVEGVGGWLVPLNEREDVASLAQRLALPVILVVGLRLGCLNHALLTAAAIRAAGLPLAGWVGNAIDPAMECLEQNLQSLADRLGIPCLGVLPFVAESRAEQGLQAAGQALLQGLACHGLLQSRGA